MVIPLQWSVHFNRDYWKDPEEFDPSRFVGEDGKFLKSEAFMPFQIGSLFCCAGWSVVNFGFSGKRMCVGEDLAKMLLFLFGASILQKFRLEVVGSVDVKGDCGITLTPKEQGIVFRSR